MGVSRFLVGDVFERLRELSDESVDLVMASPPFLALRSYLPAEHPSKRCEIGSERTPAAFIATLLDVTAELRRVLAPHGSICIELGDTYSGSGGAGGDYRPGKMRDGMPSFDGSASRTRRPRFREGTPRWDGRPEGQTRTTTSDPVDTVPARARSGWPMAKSLTGIPTLYAYSLAYGFNLLTGEESLAGQWRIRNLVHWVRPNPPVGALGDKFRPATSYLVCACIAKDRWFDLDAVRTTPQLGLPPAQGNNTKGTDERSHRFAVRIDANPAGAPPLDWWKLSTRGYKGAHYAVYPPELCERPIKAMCPERVCTVCGEPSRRMIGKAEYLDHAGRPVSPHVWSSGVVEGKGAHSNKQVTATRAAPTIGWTDCGHDAWRPGVVLDPFAGTGTTLLVAGQLGRDSIGIDLDERNAALALERIGHLDVVDMGTSVYRNVRRRSEET